MDICNDIGTKGDKKHVCDRGNARGKTRGNVSLIISPIIWKVKAEGESAT